MMPLLMYAADTGTSRIYISGRVKDAVTKFDLTEARVSVVDAAGNVVDSATCNSHRYSSVGEPVPVSSFTFSVPARDSVFTFEVTCPGYTTFVTTFELSHIKRREKWRDIPVFYMTRAPRNLGEVTVTASKIKFYNRGDTVVFNADAFQLAEGSMLDGLIAQLPGVELSDDGQIKVNGEFVESLLLNGKEFLDGNNQLMLDNIAAYTVKNVEVYRGQSRKDKWMGIVDGKQQLTMDVKLKREYNVGWIVNAQAGLGTHDRFLGRLFVNWYTPTTRLTFIGNSNNLNDNRKPGKNTTWTPDKMPTGTRRFHTGAFNYNYDNPEETVSASGSLTFEQSRANDVTTLSRTNFLGDAATFDYSFSRAHAVDTRLATKNRLMLRNNTLSGIISLDAFYRRRSSEADDLSATFDTEQAAMSREIIENLYSPGGIVDLDRVINRSATRSDGSMRQVDVRLTPCVIWLLPGTSDRLRLECYTRYSSTKEERWRDYAVNYGAESAPAVRRRQYFDDSPNHIFTSINNLTYRMSLEHCGFGLNYEYRFSDHEKDSYMYALERLADMGAYGTLPAGYLDAFDPANSYTSRLIENKHSFTPSFYYSNYLDKLNIFAELRPEFSLKHQHLDYWREGRRHLVRQSDFIVTAGRWTANVDLSFTKVTSSGKRPSFKNSILYEFEVNPTTPDPFERLDVINDADPLNITLGNPHLRTAYSFSNSIEWNFTNRNSSHPFSNFLQFNYSFTDNAITRGYTYDSATGVRTIRSYNVDGNSAASVKDGVKLQFGAASQFTLSSETAWTLTRYADMIGLDTDIPSASRVNTSVFSENLRFSWTLGKQTLSFVGSALNRHTGSSREGFDTVDARHFSYGVVGNFMLPLGFGISTDFTVYSRRGYGASYLDTDDAIWNIRATYCPPRASRWVFIVDGFDMLHQLSNVNYAVNAAGRTVSYTNALPRYVMLSVNYRFVIKPPKR